MSCTVQTGFAPSTFSSFLSRTFRSLTVDSIRDKSPEKHIINENNADLFKLGDYEFCERTLILDICVWHPFSNGTDDV